MMQSVDTTFKAKEHPTAGQRYQGVLTDRGMSPDGGWEEGVGGGGADEVMVSPKAGDHFPLPIG